MKDCNSQASEMSGDAQMTGSMCSGEVSPSVRGTARDPLEPRFRRREPARSKGIWPPKGGQPGMMIKQENMLVVPAAFSPLR
jgi:hypothetical protein